MLDEPSAKPSLPVKVPDYFKQNQNKRFACPFVKGKLTGDPEHTSCLYPGFINTARLKEHIYRRHMTIRCPRCCEKFNHRDGLKAHQRDLVPCKVNQERPADEGIDEDQEKKLRKKKRSSAAEEEKWAEIYKIIFPNEIHVPSPYCESNIPHQQESHVETHIFQRIADCLPKEASRRLRPQINEILRDENATLAILKLVASTNMEIIETIRQQFSGSETQSSSNNSGNQPQESPPVLVSAPDDSLVTPCEDISQPNKRKRCETTFNNNKRTPRTQGSGNLRSSKPFNPLLQQPQINAASRADLTFSDLSFNKWMDIANRSPGTQSSDMSLNPLPPAFSLYPNPEEDATLYGFSESSKQLRARSRSNSSSESQDYSIDLIQYSGEDLFVPDLSAPSFSFEAEAHFQDPALWITEEMDHFNSLMGS